MQRRGALRDVRRSNVRDHDIGDNSMRLCVLASSLTRGTTASVYAGLGHRLGPPEREASAQRPGLAPILEHDDPLTRGTRRCSRHVHHLLPQGVHPPD